MAVVESATAAAAAGKAAGAGGAAGAGAGAQGGAGAAGRAGASGAGNRTTPYERELARRTADRLGGDRGLLEKLALLGIAVMGFMLFLLLLLLLPVLLLVHMFASTSTPADAVPTYPSKSGIPKVYWPMYTAAAGHYGVNAYLLASIHKQESSFSSPTVGFGANKSGAMGPMQFLAGTWRGYDTAFRPIAHKRPATYPLDRRKLPSCESVPAEKGCVYDDFDAIAGAAAYLKASGADGSLDSKGTHAAVCAYIGDCAEVDRCNKGSKNRYCDVIPRAQEWEEGALALGARAIVEEVVDIAESHGRGVYVCSDFRPNSETSDGYPSDHAANDEMRAARDIAFRGVDCIGGPPSPVLDHAAVAIGAFFGRTYGLHQPILADTFHWRGYRIQIIWRTRQWGGHLGHIHVGARKL